MLKLQKCLTSPLDGKRKGGRRRETWRSKLRKNTDGDAEGKKWTPLIALYAIRREKADVSSLSNGKL